MVLEVEEILILCLLRILSIDFSYGDGGVLMFNAPLVAGSSADST